MINISVKNYMYESIIGYLSVDRMIPVFNLDAFYNEGTIVAIGKSSVPLILFETRSDFYYPYRECTFVHLVRESNRMITLLARDVYDVI